MAVSGTSFSAPIIAGAIAAIMTEAGAENLTPAQAYQLLTTYLNDGESAGEDPGLGAGMPDIGRTLNGRTPGIYDAAVASNEIIGPSAGNPNGQIAVLVQNRGTETLINTAVEVSTGAGTVTANITSLAPNAVRTVYVPIPRSPTEGGGSILIGSRVVITEGLTDVKPSNDRRIETYVPAGSR
jgi:subtilisin family serine protease